MAGALTKAGRYQIVAELGRGSMGVVYQGYDPVIDRIVAIKTMITEGLASTEFEEFKGRFLREARAAGILSHPNIVTVYDFGEDEGLLYLAMEYLEGKSLQQLIEEQNVLPVETIIPIYDQVCGALDHAHAHEIVHRDIKPANIMILGSGLVKVTDFGIAKTMSTGMTQAGQILGTPNYMSPEQVKGRPVDGRSDIFSLGVILYELVTGEKPFSGQNITTVIYKIVNENPIPPRQLDATIHPGLSYVISKTLAKSPEERYQTCRELAEDLRRYKNLTDAPAPSATVVIRVPPLQAASVESRVPPPPPREEDSPPAVVPAPSELPRPPRPLSVQVIPPVKSKPQSSWVAVWVLLMLLGGGLGGGYYVLIYRPNHLAVPVKPVVPPNGTLKVTANVDGARISIDGRSDPSWVTPYIFSDLPVGPHMVVISKEGFVDLQENVTLQGGENKIIDMKLAAPPPSTAQLEVKSNVPGAKISIDGQSDPAWVTPYTFPNLTAGTHVLALSKQGYGAWQQNVTLEAGRPGTIAAELQALERAQPPPAIRNHPKPPKPGELLVSANVGGARISIDGRSDPVWVTPYTIPDLPAGPHRVLISKEGYDDVQRTVTVEAGHTASLNVELTEPGGELNIVTEPPGIEVLIDGRSYGPSPVRATLSVGPHTYVLKRGGAELFSNTAQIKGGEILTRKISMGNAPTGIVVVRTIPPGATVYADGNPLGKTPASFRLAAGRHTLTVSLSGFHTLRKELDVPSGGSIPVDEMLSPQ